MTIPGTSYRRRLTLSTALAGGLLGVASSAGAQLPTPGDATVVAGSATISNPTATTLRVELDANRTIINWTGFSVPTANAAGFFDCRGGSCVVQPGQIAVLNRVTGAMASDISGGLTSDPNVAVYLINPNGILFGNGANVNVGSLTASTLDIGDADFLDGGSINLTGAASTGVTVNVGATGSLVASGDLVMVGAFVDVAPASTLTAGGDLAIVAAQDVTMSFGAGSPMAITINQGTPVPNAIVMGGDAGGRNIYVAMASRAGVLNALLNVTGTLIATTASATDRGVVLSAGASGSGVAVASGGGNDTGGAVDLTIAGAVTATQTAAGDVANVEARANDRLAINADLTASDDVTAAGGTVAFGGGDIEATSGAATINGAATITAATSVTAGTGVQFTGTVDGDAGVTTDDLTIVSGTGTSFLGAVGTTPLNSLSATGGPITASSNVSAVGDVTLNAGTANIDIQGTLTVGGNYSVTAGTFSNNTLAPTLTGAGSDFTIVDTAGGLILGAITAPGTLSVTVQNGGALTVNGTLASTSEDILLATQGGGAIALNGSLTTAGSRFVDLNSSAGISQTSGSISAGQLAIRAVGNVTLEQAANDFATLAASITGGGNLSVIDNRSVAGALTVGTVGSLSGVTTNGGNIVIVAGTADAAFFRDLVVSQTIASNGGNIQLRAADNVTINAPVSTDNIGMAGLQGRLELIGFASDSFGAITQTAPITANELLVRFSQNSSLTNAANNVNSIAAFTSIANRSFAYRDSDGFAIAALSDPDGAGAFGALSGLTAANLLLQSGGAITQSGGATIAATTLGLRASAATLNGANDVVTLAADTASGFAFNDANGLTIGTVAGSGGIATVIGVAGGTGPVAITTSGDLNVNQAVTATDNDISLAATGANSDIVLDQAVNAGTGTVTLQANGTNGTITQAAAGFITAGTLTGGSAGATTLDTATNQISNLGAFSAGGSFTLGDAGGFTVTGAVSGGNGVSLTTSGDLIVNAAISAAAGPVTLNATGAGADIALNASVSATAGDVDLTAEQNISGNASGTIAADAAVDLTATTGSINLAGSVTAGGDVTATAPGGISLGATSSTAGDVIATSSGGGVAFTGAVSARDIALSAAGPIMTGAMTASDDIVLRATGATGTIATGALTSGTGSNADGAADALAGGPLAGGDIDVRAASVTVAGATATGAGSDLMMRADTGQLTLGGGTVGGTATLIKTGTGAGAGELEVTGALTSSGNATIQSSTHARLGSVTSQTGNVLVEALAGEVTGVGAGGRANLAASANAADVTVRAGTLARLGTVGAGRDVSVTAGNTTGPLAGSIDVTSAAGRDVALNAIGGSVTVGTATARDDIAIRAATTINAGTLTSGVAVGSQGAVDEAGVADTLAGAMAGQDIDVRAASVTVAGATATGAGSDLMMRADTGQLTLGTGAAGGTATLTKVGTSGDLAVSTSLTAGGAVAMSSDTGARLGAITSQTGNVSVSATDLELNGAVTATANNIVLLTNSGAGATRLGDGLAASGFSLSQAELNRISAGTLTIQSNAGNVQIGALALGDAAGSARVNLLTTGRVDVTGAFATAQAGNSRTVQIGGSAADTGQASVIAVDTTQGGRLLMGNSALALRGLNIGIGQTGLLAEIGLNPGGTSISTASAATHYVGNPASRLYNPLAPTNQNVVTAYRLSVTYGNYALFQNTAPGGAPPRGVLIGAGGLNSTLTLTGTNAANAFALFGTINTREGPEAALLGPVVIVTNNIDGNNSRINGCLIGSSGGCLIASVTSLPINVFDAAQANVLRVGEELALNFDPIVGSNNDALFGSLGSVSAEPACESDSDDPLCREPEGN